MNFIVLYCPLSVNCLITSVESTLLQTIWFEVHFYISDHPDQGHSGTRRSKPHQEEAIQAWVKIRFIRINTSLGND